MKFGFHIFAQFAQKYATIKSYLHKQKGLLKVSHLSLSLGSSLMGLDFYIWDKRICTMLMCPLEWTLAKDTNKSD